MSQQICFDRKQMQYVVKDFLGLVSDGLGWDDDFQVWN
jgi:hypothetical protein